VIGERQADVADGDAREDDVVVATRNSSIPPYSVLPVLAYDDVRAAVEWLARAFGFAERVRIGDHQAQLSAGGGAVIVADATYGRRSPAGEDSVTQSVMVRVEDVDAHYLIAVAAGAQVTSEPTDYPYGERQYSVRDPSGHLWTFTESVADIAPETWGGVTVSAW
jgi:uncharacterized glyoxalase superfamily protein PhnB